MEQTIAQPRRTREIPQTGQREDTPVDIRLRLSALWIAMLFIFAYVDIFSLMRADVLDSLLDGKLVDAPFDVGQGFLMGALLYILPASLMVYFCLTLRPSISRRANIIVAALYIATIALGCIGEDWNYYLLGSAAEVVLLAKITHLAWCWPLASS